MPFWTDEMFELKEKLSQKPDQESKLPWKNSEQFRIKNRVIQKTVRSNVTNFWKFNSRAI